MENLMLDRVSSIWRDLEKSYTLMKTSLGTDTKLSFFEKIIGKYYDKETGKSKCRLNILKLKLAGEKLSYTAEQMEEYNRLSKIFTNIERELNEIKTITNLNRTVQNLENETVLDLSLVQVTSIVSREIKDKIELPMEDMYKKYKDLHSMTSIMGSMQEVRMANTTSEMVIYNSSEVKHIYDNRRNASELENKVLFFAVKDKSGSVINTLYLDRKDYNDEVFKIGRKKIQLSEIKSLENKLNFREGILGTSSEDMRVVIFV